MSESADWYDEPLLPEQTSNDTDAGWAEHEPEDDELARYLQERPPHHGD